MSVWALAGLYTGFGCRREWCISLPHSMHLTSFSQFLATCVVDAKHLKQIPFCFKKAFQSSMDFSLNPRHLLKGCGFLCIGQNLVKSILGPWVSQVVNLWGETSVVWTGMYALLVLLRCSGFELSAWRAMAKLGSFLILIPKLTSTENGGKGMLLFECIAQGHPLIL